MKKLLAILMALVLCLSLFACGKSNERSEEDKLRDQISQLENQYEDAKQQSDQFNQDVADYYDALNDLDKYN